MSTGELVGALIAVGCVCLTAIFAITGYLAKWFVTSLLDQMREARQATAANTEAIRQMRAEYDDHIILLHHITTKREQDDASG